MTTGAAFVPLAQEQLNLAIGTAPGEVSEKRCHLQLHEAGSPEPVHSVAQALGTHHFHFLLATVR